MARSARVGAQPATAWIMAKHFFPMTGRLPCEMCGEPMGVKLDVGTSGFSVTSGFEHKPECAALRCPHGILWADDCDACAAERAAKESDEQAEE